MEPLYTIHTDTERSRLVAYRHLGDRYFYPAERHRRRIEHHADYRQGTHTRVRHTQSAGCKAFSILRLIIVESVTITTFSATSAWWQASE